MSRSFLLFGFILYSVFLSSLANASDVDLSAPMDKGGWKLIWSEEFDYTGFPDSTKWSYDTEGNVYQWGNNEAQYYTCLLYTSPSPRDPKTSRMPSSA